MSTLLTKQQLDGSIASFTKKEAMLLRKRKISMIF